VFKFSIIVVCIQFFFSVLGYSAYLTHISSFKYQFESGVMFLIQYPGRDFPDPSTRNLPHPHTIKVAAKGLVGDISTHESDEKSLQSVRCEARRNKTSR
jgi:hypothetical protein